jgi:hypothetical protein
MTKDLCNEKASFTGFGQHSFIGLFAITPSLSFEKMTKLIPTHRNLPVGSIIIVIRKFSLCDSYTRIYNVVTHFAFSLPWLKSYTYTTGSRLCVTFMTTPNNCYWDLSWLMMYNVFSNWPCVVLNPWSVVPITATNSWVAYRTCVTSKTRNISAPQGVIQNYNCLRYDSILPLYLYVAIRFVSSYEWQHSVAAVNLVSGIHAFSVSLDSLLVGECCVGIFSEILISELPKKQFIIYNTESSNLWKL